MAKIEIRINKDLKTRFKVQTIKNYESMSKVIIKFIKSYIEQGEAQEHDQKEYDILFGEQNI